jgi:hypothetical protein
LKVCTKKDGPGTIAWPIGENTYTTGSVCVTANGTGKNGGCHQGVTLSAFQTQRNMVVNAENDEKMLKNGFTNG